MTTDQNDPDGLSWQIAKAVQPEIYKMLNHVSKLDHNHVRDMNVDRNRGRGTWWWAVKVADAVIAALPELQDDEPRVVETVAELGALAVGTVLRLKTGALAERADWRDGRRGLKISGSELGYQNKDWSSDFMSPGALAWTKYLPAQVLYPHPTLDAETGDQQ